MRISRPCYDKAHRCPGWIGGGMKSARVTRCDGGRIVNPYDKAWRWRFHRCDTCSVLALPTVVRWLDPAWLRFMVSDLLERDSR